MPTPLNILLTETLPDGSPGKSITVHSVEEALTTLRAQYRAGRRWDFAPGTSVPIIVDDPDSGPIAGSIPAETAIRELHTYIQNGIRFGSSSAEDHHALLERQERGALVEEVAGGAGSALGTGLAGGPLVGLGIRAGEALGVYDPEVASGVHEALALQREEHPYAYGAGMLGNLTAAALGPGLVAGAVGLGARATTLGGAATMEALGGGIVGASSAAGRLTTAGLGRLLPGAAGRTAARVGGQAVAEPLMARAAGAFVEGGVGTAGYDIADRLARNEPLVISEILSDAGVWGAVGGGAVAAFGGISSLRRAASRWGGTPGGQVVHGSRIDLADEVLNVRAATKEDLADHIMEGLRGDIQRRTSTGNAVFDSAANLTRRVSRVREDVSILASREFNRLSKEPLPAIAARAGSEAAALHNTIFREFENVTSDVIDMARIQKLPMQLPASQFSFVADEGLRVLSSVRADLVAAGVETTRSGAVLDTVKNVLEIRGAVREGHMLARAGEGGRRVFLSEEAAATRLYSTLATQYNDLNKLFMGADNATGTAIKQAKDRLKGFLEEPSLWGEAAHREGLRRTFYRETYDIRNAYLGRLSKEDFFARDVRAVKVGKASGGGKLSSFDGGAFASQFRKMGTPGGQLNYVFLQNKLDTLQDLFTKNTEHMNDASGAISAIKQARASLASNRADVVLKALELNIARAARGGAGASAAYGLGRYGASAAVGLALGSWTAGLAGAAVSKVYGTLKNPLRSMEIIRNISAAGRRSAERMVQNQGRLRSILGSGFRTAAGLSKPRHLGLVGIRAFSDIKNRQELRSSYEEAEKHILSITERPDELLDHIEMSSAPFEALGENASGYAATYLIRAAYYLRSKLPIRVQNPLDPGETLPPSVAEMDAYVRTDEAVNNPYSLFENLLDGKATSEARDAVITVWPEIYAQMALAVSDEMAALEGPINYQTRLQLATFFGIPDTTLSPDFMATMQSKQAQTPNQAQAITAVQRPVTLASSQEQSATQSLLERS